MNVSVPIMVDHLFRRTSGQVVGALVRRFGPRHLELAEDAFQEALIKALRLWPYRGVPTHPERWLIRVATNWAIDNLRRGRVTVDWTVGLEDEPVADDEDLLATMFLCCSPALPPASQVALILNLVAGFSVTEVARAFLANEATVYQRLSRAKRKLAAADEPGRNGETWMASDRLDGLLVALYLMFNEGYALTSGSDHVSADLCNEAIRLTRVLVSSTMIDRPDIEALLALMLFHAARIPARLGSNSQILRLSEQDRSKWNHGFVDEAIGVLNRSARGEALSVYHLQAGIASFHAVAESYEETDWPSILDHYDALRERSDSPLVLLNRCVAYAMVHGPDAGLDELDATIGQTALDRYALFHATTAELAARSGDLDRAETSFVRAKDLSGSIPERQFLDGRLAQYGLAKSNLKIGPKNT